MARDETIAHRATRRGTTTPGRWAAVGLALALLAGLGGRPGAAPARAQSPPTSQTFSFNGVYDANEDYGVIPTVQHFTVPFGVTSIRIEARGGSGGLGQGRDGVCCNFGGLGAQMNGDFTVTPGEVLSVLVGEKGGNGLTGGGGGGSFIWRGAGPLQSVSQLMVAAAGGGGAGGDEGANINNGFMHHGKWDRPAEPGVGADIGGVPNSQQGTRGAGGTGTSGGGGGGAYRTFSGGGGGGGVTGDGGKGGDGAVFQTNPPRIDEGGGGGRSLTGGGAGGGTSGNARQFASGGFGGGGEGTWGGGGGGGYAGGGGGPGGPSLNPNNGVPTGYNGGGGGGSSYNAGANQNNHVGQERGHGAVTIRWTNPPPTPPMFTSATSATFRVGATNSHTVAATGFPKPALSVSGALPAGVSFDAASGVLDGSGAALAGSVGTHTLTLIATNSAGMASQTFTLSVRDLDPPTLTVPSAIIQEATGPNGAPVTFAVSAMDNVSANPTIACTGSGATTGTVASGATFALGVTSVSCVATDAAGNASPARTFGVTVRDTTPPTLAQPAGPVVVEATSGSGAIATYAAPTATDLVDPAPTVTCAPPSGASFPFGNTTVSCTARDAAGNVSMAKTFTVTVRDTTPPTITAPPAVTVEATSPTGATVSDATLGRPTVSDVNQPVALSRSPMGNQFAVGATTVTWTATDAAGNTATASQTVTVRDTTPPTLTVPAAPIVAQATSASGVTVNLAAQVTASDNADPAPTVSCTPPLGGAFPIGDTTVSCTARDASGNSSQAKTFTVRITPPTCAGQAATILAKPGVPTQGTAGRDVIVGTDGPDVIRAGTGDDLICAAGGDDQVHGEGGDDVLYGDAGNDTLDGGLGDDTVAGGDGDDTLVGGGGHDALDGDAGADTLDGDAGNDRLNGGAGLDTLRGGPGNDTLVDPDPANALLDGGSGTDSCSAQTSPRLNCEAVLP